MSDVEAKREARRRRILENSEKRLQRITGVQQRKASYELEGFRSSQSVETENHVPIPNVEYKNHSSSPQSNLSLDSNHYTPQLETIYRNPLLSSSILNRSSIASTEKLTFTKSYRIPLIIGIAFLINLLHFFLKGQDYLLLNKIFIPLLCFEGVYLYYNQNSETTDETTNILRLFIKNIPPHHLSLVIKYLTLFITVTKDVMIYFFAFVCIWFIFKVLHGILFF